MRLKTVDRFVLRSYQWPMVLAFAIVMFILLLNFLWLNIDQLVGKGLSASVVAELIGYVFITLIPMGLPLSMLFAAVMTMGNLGENYELLAMKSAGMSLMRILRPVLVVMAIIALSSFFISNNVVPWAWERSQALMRDVKRQKQNIEFKDGIFFNGIDGMSVRVERQRPEDHLLMGVLIYDNTDPDRKGTMKTTLADSGYIRLSEDKRNLVVQLYNGVMYETNRQPRRDEWYDQSTLTATRFVEQYVMQSLAGFDLERTDAESVGGGQSKNIVELQHNIDSLAEEVALRTETSYAPLMNDALFSNDKSFMTDSLRDSTTHVKPVAVLDSIAGFDMERRQRLWHSAEQSADNSRSMLNWDEQNLKDALRNLYSYRISWHEKVSLPFSVLIFFMIGAALGAIIRRGGLGMPVVVSVLFFVLYYVINIFGRRSAGEGTIGALVGIWMSSFVLFPVAAFLVWKATNDSNLFNPEWYIYRWRKVKKLLIRK